MSRLSDYESFNTISSITLNVREDGRQRNDVRPFVVKRGVIPHAAGSALVTIPNGDPAFETRVLVSISCTVEEVGASTADDKGYGSLEVHLDCIPSVTDTYGRIFSGGASQRSGPAALQRGRLAFLTHLTRSLSALLGSRVSLSSSTLRGALEVTSSVSPHTPEESDKGDTAGEDSSETSGAMPSSPMPTTKRPRCCKSLYKDLYIGSGFAYSLNADVHVMQGDSGGLLMAASIGINCALRDALLPKTTITTAADGSVSVEVDVHRKRQEGGQSSTPPLQIHDVPVLLDAVLHDGFYAVDPTLLEELALPAGFLVGVTEDKKITYVQQLTRLTRRPWTPQSTLSTPSDLHAYLEDVTEAGQSIFDEIRTQMRDEVPADFD